MTSSLLPKTAISVPHDVAAEAQAALTITELKLGALVNNHPGVFPLFTKSGQWIHDSPAWTNWCEGFLGGQLWILAEQTQEARWRDQAVSYSQALRGREFDRDVHDLGFIFWPTWWKWYQLDGDTELDEVVIQAGRTMGPAVQRACRVLAILPRRGIDIHRHHDECRHYSVRRGARW